MRKHDVGLDIPWRRFLLGVSRIHDDHGCLKCVYERDSIGWVDDSDDRQFCFVSFGHRANDVDDCVSWIAVRPLFAIPLIVVGVAAAVMAWRSSRKKPVSAPAYSSAGEAQQC